MIAQPRPAFMTIPTAAPSHVAPIPTVVPDQPECHHVHHDGKATLWVVFVIMVLSSALFAGLASRVPLSKRLFHVVTALTTIVASLSYFAMASGHGVSYHHVQVRHSHAHVPDTFHDLYRQVYWARYIDWALTTPLVLLNLGFLTGLSGAHLLMAVVADVVMMLSGLFSAFGNEGTPQKWGWYAIACISYLVVLFHLVVHGRTQAKAKGSELHRFFVTIGIFTLLVWTAYPIIWGVAPGARKISVDGEIIAYAVLDLLAKPIFGFWLLFALGRTAEANMELGGFWTHGLSREGMLRLSGGDGA